MIGDVLTLVKNQLNIHFDSLSSGVVGEVREERVVFVDGDQNTDSILFKTGAVNVILYHIEHENTLRQGDPYMRIASNGATQRVQPDVRINLYILMVAKFKDYEQGLHYLSQIIKFFQSHRYFNRQNTPLMGKDIEEVILDPVALPLKEQYDIFGMLRTSYFPSVVYRARTIVFKDEDALPSPEPGENVDRHFISLG
jgi:hypothetical protein